MGSLGGRGDGLAGLYVQDDAAMMSHGPLTVPSRPRDECVRIRFNRPAYRRRLGLRLVRSEPPNQLTRCRLGSLPEPVAAQQPIGPK